MKNIVCLISGRGSNLEALLRCERAEDWAGTLGARVACVISNRVDARGLDLARDFGVSNAVVPHRDYATREAFEAALVQAIEVHTPQLVVLAGFMRVLTASFVERYSGRLLNIHPSLLPSFPGLHTHRRALEAGVKVHGCTVHFVANEVDGGPIIGQAAVKVHADDSEDSLAARVLEQEHKLLPRCVRWACEGKVALVDGRTVVRGLAPDAQSLLAAA